MSSSARHLLKFYDIQNRHRQDSAMAKSDMLSKWGRNSYSLFEPGQPYTKLSNFNEPLEVTNKRHLIYDLSMHAQFHDSLLSHVEKLI